MRFETKIGTSIEEAVHWLNEGELVGIPTETVYGLAGNGLRSEVISRIFEVKNRPFFDPLILHFSEIESVVPCIKKFPEDAQTLMSEFWPGPLTMVLPKSEKIPDLATAGTPNVAVRIPRHPMTLGLLQQLKFPLAAPSANPFSYVSPTTAQHVYDQLQGKIPYILDGGSAKIGMESTIVSFSREVPRIIRLGGISVEQIQSILPHAIVDVQFHPNETAESAGQAIKHYAPRCELIPLEDLDTAALEPHSSLVILRYSRNDSPKSSAKTYYLSENGDESEAAHHLFGMLRTFDELNIPRVYFEWAPHRGLGRAINDRLMRAQKKSS
jgi:L-threonylcarbamoyladenylate synthase